jgi:hypothetical protein
MKIKKIVSEVMAIAALVILLVYVSDALVGQGEAGFIPMTVEERGRTLGTSSMILFFVAFAVGFKERSPILTILLIVGGAIMGTSVLAASVMAEGGLVEAPAAFLGVIVIGYIIMGLGIIRIIQKKMKD